MEKYLETLQRCALFDNITADELVLMLGCLDAKVSVYGKNETVFSEGDPANRMGVLLSGAVQIVKEDFFGNRSIVTSIEPSQLFGESFACGGIETIPVSAVAVEKSEIMLIDSRRITVTCCNACAFHSRMIMNLLRGVAENNLRLNQKLEIMSKRTTKEKLMTYLLDQAKRSRSSSFVIPFDRQELADYLGVERSALSAEIGKLRREGILESRKNRFELL